ncbi:hypothetical protein F2P81_010911 [Scophthalmus maximus]|uniref:Uncharacterized protein n=1 Tax=Scophthalmus maximus TaxID=52904 RepID=A0A6A4SWW3_SCOMX|nr:hypothetical protein F2P81_010911 [Scophthalmus maximus]
MANFQPYQLNPKSDTDREEEQAGSPEAFQPRLDPDVSEWPRAELPQLIRPAEHLQHLQNGLRTSEVQNRRRLVLWDATTGSSSRYASSSGSGRSFLIQLTCMLASDHPLTEA